MMIPIQRLARLCALVALALGGMMIPGAILAQDETDTTWDDLGLDPEGFKYDEDVFGHVSTGWFPQAYTGYTLSLSGELFYADVWDRAYDIRPRAFRPTTAPFTHKNPFRGDEREILQPNSEEEEDDGYPTASYAEYQAVFLYNLPMPAVVRLSSGLGITEGMLFAHDTTRNYLSLSGVPQPLKEVGVMHLKQYGLTGSAGLNIPLYGGFIESEAATFASYYYIYGGLSASYVISSKGTQYSQIANAKGEIRYGNGTDTVTLINKGKLEGLNRVRTAIEVAAGWNLAFESVAMGIEAFVSIPQTSVLNDVAWKQYYAGFRISIGGHWLPEKKKRKL